MRFSHLSLLALAGSSIASPITKRVDAISLLEDLYATVQTYTGAINATIAPLSSTSSIIDKTAATIQVGQQLNLITEAITSTTNEFNALPAANATKRSVALEVVDTDASQLNSHPKEKRQLIAVSALLGLIIVEIFATITAAVAILGLAGLLVYINPLTAALSLLILTVQLVLNIVLVGVSALLNSLLAALALSIGGL